MPLTIWMMRFMPLVSCSTQLVERVDVAEGVRLVVERDLDGLERRIPCIDLASAAGEKSLQVGRDRAPHQREYRMRLVAGLRHRQIIGTEVLLQARDEIRRQERRIARHGHRERLRNGGEPGVQAGE